MRFIIVYDGIKLDFYLVTRTSKARKKRREIQTHGHVMWLEGLAVMI